MAATVLVNAVAPGKILTGSPEQVNEEAIAYSHARTPFFRLGQPSDVAARLLPGLATTRSTSRAPTSWSTAAGWPTESDRRAQGTVEVVDQVARVLQSHRQADRARPDPDL